VSVENRETSSARESEIEKRRDSERVRGEKGGEREGENGG